MIALICDRCGQVMRGRTEVENVTKVSLSTTKAGVYDTRHLCEDCLEAFELFLQDHEKGDDGHGG